MSTEHQNSSENQGRGSPALSRMEHAAAIAILSATIVYSAYENLYESSSASSDVAACGAPSPRSVREVDTLFDRPADLVASGKKRQAEAILNTDLGAFGRQPYTTEKQREKFAQNMNLLLSKYGTALYPAPYIALLPSSQTWNHLDPHGRQLAQEKYNMLSAYGSLKDLPVSYTRFANLQEVRMYRDFGDEKGAYVDYAQKPIPKTAYFNTTTYNDWRSLPHEIGHLIDRKMCGDSTIKDPVYARFNKGQVYRDLPNLDDYNQLKDSRIEASKPALEKQMNQIDDQRDKAAWENDRHRFNRLSNLRRKILNGFSIISGYSAKSVEEDKAELFSYLDAPYDIRIVLNKNIPRIRDKFTLLMARLFQKRPDIVREFAASAERPTGDDDFHDYMNWSQMYGNDSNTFVNHDSGDISLRP